MGKSTISMAIFNSYVSLPEGILKKPRDIIYFRHDDLPAPPSEALEALSPRACCPTTPWAPPFHPNETRRGSDGDSTSRFSMGNTWENCDMNHGYMRYNGDIMYLITYNQHVYIYIIYIVIIYVWLFIWITYFQLASWLSDKSLK